MEVPAALASGIAALGAILAAPVWVGLILASFAGDSARIGELSAGLIEGAVYAAVAASIGLSSLGAVGVLIVKGLASD